MRSLAWLDAAIINGLDPDRVPGTLPEWSRYRQMKRMLYAIAGILIGSLAVFMVYRLVREIGLPALWHSLSEVSPQVIAYGLAFTSSSFVVIIAQEWLALRYAGARVRPARAAATVTAALGVGHSLGLALLSSGAIRYRMYSRSDVGIHAIGAIIAFSATSVLLGFLTVGSSALIIAPQAIASLADLPVVWVSALGWGCIGVLVAYLATCIGWRGSLRIARRNYSLPVPWMAIGQLILGSLNIVFIAATLYVCLRHYVEIGYGATVQLRIAADIAAAIGHVPGGWGVLELAAVHVAGNEALSGVILFRGIYNLVPLATGATIFLIDELLSWRTGRQERPASVGKEARAR